MSSSNNSCHNFSTFERIYYNKIKDDPERIKRRKEMCNTENQWYDFKLLILFQ